MRLPYRSNLQPSKPIIVRVCSMNPQNYKNNNPQITQMNADKNFEKNDLRESTQSADKTA